MQALASTRVLAGQRLAACSNGQRTTMKSKSTYQARHGEGRGAPAAALGRPSRRAHHIAPRIGPRAPP